jgi:hypothetical protein
MPDDVLIVERLARIGPLKRGGHAPPTNNAPCDCCVMEAVAFVRQILNPLAS